LSLKKLSRNTNDKESHQLKVTKECLLDANLSAQALPFLKICDQHKRSPSWRQFAHLFRKAHGTIVWFSKANSADFQSFFIHKYFHPFLFAISMAKIISSSFAWLRLKDHAVPCCFWPELSDLILTVEIDLTRKTQILI
jgi:hypothetical protein